MKTRDEQRKNLDGIPLHLGAMQLTRQNTNFFCATRTLIVGMVATLFLPFIPITNATPYLWTLQGVTFNDGAVATNSFFHDSAIVGNGAFFFTSPTPFVSINPELPRVQQIPDSNITVGPTPNWGSIVYSAPDEHPTVTHMVKVLGPTEVQFTYDYQGTALGVLHLSFASLLHVPLSSPAEIEVTGYENRYTIAGDIYTHTIVGGTVTSLAIPTAIPEPETYILMALGLALMGWTINRKKFAG